MQPVRYRLQGVRYANGEVSLQARPVPQFEDERPKQNLKNPAQAEIKTTATAA